MLIQNLKTNWTRIPQWHQLQLRRSELVEQAQLIHNKDTGKWLTYHQLIRNPKHKATWSHSAANKFGRLANGVGGCIKGTNTLIFITKDQVPGERRKDVTYGRYSWDYKPNKEEKWRTQLTARLEEIALSTQTAAAPQQQICSYSKYFWTALSQPKEQIASWSTSKTSTWTLLWNDTSTCTQKYQRFQMK